MHLAQHVSFDRFNRICLSVTGIRIKYREADADSSADTPIPQYRGIDTSAVIRTG